MIELRWNDGDLEYRQRGFQIDASMGFCGVTDFGEWEKVPTESESQSKIDNLSMLVRRLLRVCHPDASELKEQAKGYLKSMT